MTETPFAAYAAVDVSVSAVTVVSSDGSETSWSYAAASVASAKTVARALQTWAMTRPIVLPGITVRMWDGQVSQLPEEVFLCILIDAPVVDSSSSSSGFDEGRSLRDAVIHNECLRFSPIGN